MKHITYLCIAFSSSYARAAYTSYIDKTNYDEDDGSALIRSALPTSLEIIVNLALTNPQDKYITQMCYKDVRIALDQIIIDSFKKDNNKTLIRVIKVNCINLGPELRFVTEDEKEIIDNIVTDLQNVKGSVARYHGFNKSRRSHMKLLIDKSIHIINNECKDVIVRSTKNPAITWKLIDNTLEMVKDKSTYLHEHPEYHSKVKFVSSYLNLKHPIDKKVDKGHLFINCTYDQILDKHHTYDITNKNKPKLNADINETKAENNIAYVTMNPSPFPIKDNNVQENMLENRSQDINLSSPQSSEVASDKPQNRKQRRDIEFGRKEKTP